MNANFSCPKVTFGFFICLYCISVCLFCIFILFICNWSLNVDPTKLIIIVSTVVNISFIYLWFHKIILICHMIIEDLSVFVIVKYVDSLIIDTVNNNHFNDDNFDYFFIFV